MIAHDVSNSIDLSDRQRAVERGNAKLRTSCERYHRHEAQNIQSLSQIVSSEVEGTSFNLSQRIYLAGFLPIKSLECTMAKRKSKSKGKKK